MRRRILSQSVTPTVQRVGLPQATISLLGTTAVSNPANPVVAAGLSFGPYVPGRIIALVFCMNVSFARSLTSVDIGGVAGTAVLDGLGGGSNTIGFFIYYSETTAETGSTTTTWSAGLVGTYVQSVYRINAFNNPGAYDAEFQNAILATTVSCNTSLLKGGAAIGIFRSQGTAQVPSVTNSGVDPVYNDVNNAQLGASTYGTFHLQSTESATRALSVVTGVATSKHVYTASWR